MWSFVRNARDVMHSNALRRVGLEGVRHTAGALPRPAPPAFRSTVGCSCFFLLLTRAHVTFSCRVSSCRVCSALPFSGFSTFFYAISLMSRLDSIVRFGVLP